MTTSGHSSAILDSKNRQLCKGFDVTAVRTTSGVDSTRAPVDRAAAVTQPHPDELIVIAAAALTYHQPPDRRAGSNQ